MLRSNEASGTWRKTTMLALSIAPALLTSVPCSAGDLLPPQVYMTTPTGVNIADLSGIITNVDLVIGNLNLQRFHVDAAREAGKPFFGARTTHNFDIYVVRNRTPGAPAGCKGGITCYLPERDKPVVHIGSSASGTYVQGITGGEAPFPSNDDALGGKLEGGGTLSTPYKYTDAYGTIYTFNPGVTAGGEYSQRVASVLKSNGERTVFLYDGNGLLKVVYNNNGFAIVFDNITNSAGSLIIGSSVGTACGYNLAQTSISVSSTCNSSNLKTNYVYSAGSLGTLQSFTDASGNVTQYTYNSSFIVTCVKPPGYSSCKITSVGGPQSAGKPPRIGTQTLADGSVWQFQYGASPDYGSGFLCADQRDADCVEEDGTRATWVTDPTGAVTQYSFTNTSPYAIKNSLGRTTRFWYTGGGDYECSCAEAAQGSRLTRVQYPEGNEYLATYGPHNVLSSQTWKAKPGSNQADVSMSYQFNCYEPHDDWGPTCALPISMTDTRGGVTNYTYDPVHGGILTESSPADANGVRAVKRYAYAQRSAYISDGAGGYASTGYPIWLKTEERTCRRTATVGNACAGGATDEVVTAYDYGPDFGAGTPTAPNNLLIRGVYVTAGGVTLRTCYRYDQYGNKVSETKPKGVAAGTVCP